MSSTTSEARPLPDPPTDGISSLSYLPQNPSSPSSRMLASSSWDGCIRIHDTSAMSHVVTHNMEIGPLLSLATPQVIGGMGSTVISGGLSGAVCMYDIPSATLQYIGRHTGSGDTNKLGCSCLASLDGLLPSSSLGASVIASAAWDSKFHLWDIRIAGTAACTVDLPGKAFSMDSNASHGNHSVIVATAGRRNVVLDVRMPSAEDATPEVMVVQDRESSLKYQTRCVRFFPDGNGLALGSIEGRVAIEFLDESSTNEKGKKKKYAFKCHRVGDTVYPVNAIAFHPRYGTFATGGCDGAVVMWDGANKKRLTALPKLATSIAAMTFNHDGTELAMASSYSFEEGEREHPRDEIFVRTMADQECRPKSIK